MKQYKKLIINKSKPIDIIIIKIHDSMHFTQKSNIINRSS